MIAGIIVLLLLAIYAPQLWVRYVMRRYAREIPGMPGNGGEFARFLIDKLELTGVGVEVADERGDHYDSQARMVRLSRTNHDGKSLTAVAVAAHEVGHALQDKEGYRWIRLRTRLYPKIRTMERMAVMALGAMPIVTGMLRAPAVAAIMVIAGLTLFFARVGFHVMTLPLEWNASFAKALPIIEDGQYVAPGEHAAVKTVLRAAALTYVASALADILSFWRWLLIFRGRWI